MSTFIDSLTFLDEQHRRALATEKLTAPEAFKHVSAADLRALGLTLGEASGVLEAARVAGDKSAAAAVQARIHQALKAGDLALLQELGVRHVVPGADAPVDPARTGALLEHLAAGGSLPRVWQGQPVRAIADLTAVAVLRSPVPPREELQAGRDPKSGVEWAQLGEAGLQVTAHGYQEGFFRGMADAAVFLVMLGEKQPELRQAVEQHFKASATTRPPQPTEAPLALNGAPLSQLCTLLGMFSTSELTRLIAFLPEGDVMTSELPGQASPATFAYEAANLLHRRGIVKTRELWRALAEGRPRRRAEVGAVAALYGVVV